MTRWFFLSLIVLVASPLAAQHQALPHNVAPASAGVPAVRLDED